MSEKVRTHKRSVEASNASMSPDMVSAAKNAAKRNRGERRKAANISAMKQQANERAKPGYATKQTAKLDARLGKGAGASRERARLSKMV